MTVREIQPSDKAAIVTDGTLWCQVEPSAAISIRDARLEDMPTVLVMLGSHWPDLSFGNQPPDFERLSRIYRWTITTDTVGAWVLCRGEEVVGFLALAISPQLVTGELLATEFWWYVDPSVRGRGGFQLLKHGEKWAASHCAVVQVSVHNERLRPMMERLGYRVTEMTFQKELRDVLR